MPDDLSLQLKELTSKIDTLARSMEDVQRVLKDVLTVDKMNNQLTSQSANYLCKVTSEVLGIARYLNVSESVRNGLTVDRAEDVRRFNELMGLIWPQSVSGFPKVRLGNGGDGGYVLLQDFDAIETVYSLGIRDDVSFDSDILRHGPNVRMVWQYDDSVDKPPYDNPKFRFTRKRINSVADLGTISPNSLLKIDIEGSEWDFFVSCSDADLNQFRQIACELHDFYLYRNEAWYARARAVLEKLHRTHQAVHVHGNNISPPFWTGDRFAPQALEVAFVRRSDYVFVPYQETIPGHLDAPSSIFYPEIKVSLTGQGVDKPQLNPPPQPPSGERFKIDL